MEPPNMNPLIHWGNKGIIIRGFHFLDPLGGLGSCVCMRGTAIQKQT